MDKIKPESVAPPGKLFSPVGWASCSQEAENIF